MKTCSQDKVQTSPVQPRSGSLIASFKYAWVGRADKDCDWLIHFSQPYAAQLARLQGLRSRSIELSTQCKWRGACWATLANHESGVGELGQVWGFLGMDIYIFLYFLLRFYFRKLDSTGSFLMLFRGGRWVLLNQSRAPSRCQNLKGWIRGMHGKPTSSTLKGLDSLEDLRVYPQFFMSAFCPPSQGCPWFGIITPQFETPIATCRHLFPRQTRLALVVVRQMALLLAPGIN